MKCKLKTGGKGGSPLQLHRATFFGFSYKPNSGKGEGEVHPITTTTAQRWDTIWGWVVKATLQPNYSRERPGTHCIGGWVGPMAGLDGYGKSRSPDCPARSESLYRLSYAGPPIFRHYKCRVRQKNVYTF